MITETITYTDFNGKERTEDFLFNLNKTELFELMIELPDGLMDGVAAEQKPTELGAAKLIMAALGNKGVNKFFKELILKAYGEKSVDGRRFVKSEELSTAFSQTPAFDDLYFRMVTDANKAAEFVNQLIPASLLDSAKATAPTAIANT